MKTNSPTREILSLDRQIVVATRQFPYLEIYDNSVFKIVFPDAPQFEFEVKIDENFPVSKPSIKLNDEEFKTSLTTYWMQNYTLYHIIHHLHLHAIANRPPISPSGSPVSTKFGSRWSNLASPISSRRSSAANSTVGTPKSNKNNSVRPNKGRNTFNNENSPVNKNSKKTSKEMNISDIGSSSFTMSEEDSSRAQKFIAPVNDSSTIDSFIDIQSPPPKTSKQNKVDKSSDSDSDDESSNKKNKENAKSFIDSSDDEESSNKKNKENAKSFIDSSDDEESSNKKNKENTKTFIDSSDDEESERSTNNKQNQNKSEKNENQLDNESEKSDDISSRSLKSDNNEAADDFIDVNNVASRGIDLSSIKDDLVNKSLTEFKENAKSMGLDFSLVDNGEEEDTFESLVQKLNQLFHKRQIDIELYISYYKNLRGIQPYDIFDESLSEKSTPE
ncbi:hypothetical protein TRFO_20934 [Tritrichomonas foetus]|uniref:Uncharacterized protein n=1 Tax=Tritrichomonas foetus TaxID=1144522 RepID=A0A1J4KFM7_9EUKA|nr:hypothetical protein TRFO_20934 [Tritrichomonas foetus]|eukprot:OHT10019.1 hypothetical protein TRFO_20934 [Tritrichomonas foetus]